MPIAVFPPDTYMMRRKHPCKKKTQGKNIPTGRAICAKALILE